MGLAAAASAQLLGAAVVMIGDMNKERLRTRRAVGFEPIDLTKSDKLEDLIEAVVGVPEVDAAVDAVGFEAHGHGAHHKTEAPATVLNSLMTITRAAGAHRHPRPLCDGRSGRRGRGRAVTGNLRMRFGLGWAKSHVFSTGQTPVLKYNRALMQAILHDRLPIAKIVNATVIALDKAPAGLQELRCGGREEVRPRSARPAREGRLTSCS